MSDPETFARQRIEDVRRLSEEFGNKKLNLVRPDTPSREGIWCVPVTVDDKRKMEGSSHNEKFRAYLTNMPLPWGGRCWGAEVMGTTRGDARPEALPEDQAPLTDDLKILYEGLKIIEAKGG